MANSFRSVSSLLVSEFSYRMFSSKRTSPGFNERANCLTPVIFGENLTSLFNNSPSFLATGANESSGLRSPFGLPRWAIIVMEQLLVSNLFIVLNDARILPSSVMTPSLIGTFKSQRKITCAFCGFRSERSFTSITD
ncbi:unannotated protein [freshwater metagenome]|uniref:Unannotated protein n=1 Tax=freshwater metagenome TaxID=449393 RepID=A0A6J6CHS8_9ZZZZ